MREPVALVAHGGRLDARGERVGGPADVLARVVGADADAGLAAGGDAPAVAAAHERALDPDVEGVAVALGMGMDLEAAAERCLGRLVVRVGRGRAASPSRRPRAAPRTRRGRLATVAARASIDRRALEARVAALRPQQLAQLAVVEGRPAPRQAVAHRPVRRGEGHGRQLPADRGGDAHGVQPWRGGRAGRGGALADLVAVDDEHVGAGARQLARDGEPRERRAADEDVGARHRPSAARAASHGRNRTRVPSTS